MVYTTSSRGSISIVTPSQRKSFSSTQPPSLSNVNSLSNLQNSLSGSSGSSNSSNVVTQTGVTSVGDNKNGKSCAFVNVIFPKPFSKQPIVHGQILIDQHTMTSSSQGVVKEVSNTYAVTILSTTTTGFCCAVRRVSKKKEKPWISNIRLEWFATLPSFCSGRTVVGIPNPTNTPNINVPTGHTHGSSSSDTIMMLANGNGGSMIMNPSLSSQAANSNSLVYLMSVTINLPPIPTSWNYGYNGSTMSHPSKQHTVYNSSGDLYSSSFDSNSLMNSQVTVPESPTVSTNLMYSNNVPTLIPSHPPVVIVTPHSSDGNSDDTFVATVREVYPNRFVAIVRRISFDNISKPWTQPIKLNWTVFYNSPQIPNPFGKDCIIKAGILPVGQNITSDDYVDREIRFLQNDIPNIPGNDFVMPRMVICTPRCDPQLPSNDIHSVTIKTISPYGFSVNLRHADSRTWHQNLYICYLAFYKVKRQKTKRNESEIVTQPVVARKNKSNGPTVVPYNTQIFIKNCTNGFVFEANLNDNSVVITSEKSFLLSQSQRFIFRESGFIELSQNCDYVLECITLEEGSDIVVSEKRDTDNATQKWLVFQPVNPLSTDSVCIANVGNLNLVLDCENGRGSAPYLSNLNMSVGSSSSQFAEDSTPTLSGENSHDQTLTIKDKSKTQQWKFTMVQENL